MSRTAILGVLAFLATGCPVSTATTSSTMPRGGGAAHGVSDGHITIPNVFAMPREQAIAALRSAGVQGSITTDDSLCGSLVEGRVIELGQVCYQHPPPGRAQGARLPVSIRVQTENPWHGNAGKITEWRLMPDLVGMTIEQARAEMKRVGFVRDERVFLQWVDEPSCKPLTVCRTYPEALQRAGLQSDKVVYAGRDPNAKPRVVEPERTGSTDSTTTADSKPGKPAASKPEASKNTKPEPFF